MATELQDVPLRAPIADTKGNLTPVWSGWFRAAVLRLGGSVALSNKELEDINDSGIVDLQAAVTLLTTRVTTLESEVEGLSQGQDV
jgi:hypothetical protein